MYHDIIVIDERLESMNIQIWMEFIGFLSSMDMQPTILPQVSARHIVIKKLVFSTEAQFSSYLRKIEGTKYAYISSHICLNMWKLSFKDTSLI